MKKIFLFLAIAIFFIFTDSQAQNVLVLKNIKTGSKRSLKPGSRIFIQQANSNIFIKARIEGFNDSVITVYTPDEDEQLLRDYTLSQISAIRKPTTLHQISYFVGSLFLIQGVYLIAEGNVISEHTARDDRPGLFRILGIISIGLGSSPFFIKPKTYNLHTDYSATLEQR